MNLQRIFSRLQGVWHFSRNLQSKMRDFPSGDVKGQATFAATDMNTLLYKETGEFTTTQQETFKVNKEYLYRYNQDKGTIEKHFIENKKTRLFYMLKFSPLSAAKTFSATGDHLCDQDNYKALYEFPSHSFDTFKLTYTVKGPKKEYMSETTYTREKPTIVEPLH